MCIDRDAKSSLIREKFVNQVGIKSLKTSHRGVRADINKTFLKVVGEVKTTHLNRGAHVYILIL